MPETKLNDEKVLRMFVDRLIAEKGGESLEAKQKETLQGELLEELDERIQQAMVRALPDAKLMELEKLLDAEAPDEEIESFFSGAGVDFNPALKKVMSDFQNDYFTDKVKVSVKTKWTAKPAEVSKTTAPAAASETAASEGAAAPVAPAAVPEAAAPVAAVPAADAPSAAASATIATPAVAAQVPVQQVTQQATQGQPTQGTTSAVPGQSNVEGAAQASQPVVMVAAQGGAANPAAEGMVDVASGVPASSPAPASGLAPAGEPALQAAPNLMDALNTATANLNAAAASMGATQVNPAEANTEAIQVNPAVGQVAPAASQAAGAAQVNPTTPTVGMTQASVAQVNPAANGSEVNPGMNMGEATNNTGNVEMTGKEA